MPYNYVAFGFRISSDFDCPEFLKSEKGDDVHLAFGPVPGYLPESQMVGVGCAIATAQCLVDIPGVARYLIQNGDRISIERAVSAEIDAVNLFLLGTAFGALLHQRNVFPLHASAVETRRGAVAFVGPSGAGKSTLAAALYQRGYRILADDICAIEASGTVSVLPAGPYLMLWRDALNELGLNPDNFRRVRQSLEKFYLPARNGFTAQSVPLHAIYELQPENSGDIALTPVRGVGRLRTLTQNTFRKQFVDPMGLTESHSNLVIGTAGAGKVVCVRYPRRQTPVQALADLLERDFGA